MPDETIAWYQILVAAVLTGAVVWLTARSSNWPLGSTLGAVFGAALLIGLWRWLGNAWHLNDDFMPLVSIGDAVCLIMGAVGPALAVLTVRGRTTNRWLPALVGGVAGFVINVVVL